MYFCYKTGFPFKTILNLDPSNKMDLDFKIVLEGKFASYNPTDMPELLQGSHNLGFHREITEFNQNIIIITPSTTEALH